MAEEESKEGSWWGGWLQAAKEKSTSALEFMKKDLTEFTCTVKDDTTAAATTVKEKFTQESASTASMKVKEGVNTLLGGITKALTIEAEDKHQPAKRSITKPPIFDRAKARLHAVQVDPGTYLNDPDYPPEQYRTWQEDFNIDNMKGDISELLVANVEVRSLYTQMVPAAVSHADFWKRYFFKTHQLRLAEDRRAALVKLADKVTDQQDLEWDDEDWCDLAAPNSPTDFSPSQKAFPVGDSRNSDFIDHKEPSPGTSQTERPTIPETDKRVPDITDNVGESNQKATGITVNNQKNPENKEDINQPVLGTPLTSTEPQLESTDKIRIIEDNSGDVKKEIETKEDTNVTSETANQTNPPAEDIVLDTKPRSDSDIELSTKLKGDLVVVAPDSSGEGSSARTSPSAGNKESSLDDDWDCDLEVTAEEMELAEKVVHRLADAVTDGAEDQDDDWENWE